MRTTFTKRGNSAVARIPASVLEATRLRPDQVVDVRKEKGHIGIDAAESKTYALNELLACITPENIHADVDTGGPVGKEIL